MKIKMNLSGNFKLVPNGDRILTITKAECTPSGKPNKLKVTFQDSEGGYINSQYNFDNSTSLFAMGKLLEVALDFKDGDEFDTKEDSAKLVGLKLLCEVVHTEGTQTDENGEVKVFANVKRVHERIDNEKTESKSPRGEVIENSSYDL